MQRTVGFAVPGRADQGKPPEPHVQEGTIVHTFPEVHTALF